MKRLVLQCIALVAITPICLPAIVIGFLVRLASLSYESGMRRCNAFAEWVQS